MGDGISKTMLSNSSNIYYLTSDFQCSHLYDFYHESLAYIFIYACLGR